MSRPVLLRAAAATDIDAAIAHYRTDGGLGVAVDFVEHLEGAVERIRRSPHIGSLRFSYELSIPELRAWALRRFPYVILYLPGDDAIDVWRVLHGRRDIPTSFSGER